MTEYENTDDEPEPFELVKRHRQTLQEIQDLEDNLRELKREVRHAEWTALGGRGYCDMERVDALCEAVAEGMSFIQDDIHELREDDAEA